MSWHNMDGWSGKTLLKDWWDKVRDNLEYLKTSFKRLHYYGNSELTPSEGFTFITTGGGKAAVAEYTGSDTEVVIPYEYSGYPVINISERAFDFEGKAQITSVTIPKSVTAIGNYVFKDLTNLESIIIPDSVTSIGAFAFDGCTALRSVTIPDSVNNIYDNAFAGCTALTNVTMSNSVTRIGESVFERCTNLTSVNIPDNVTSIGVCAFKDCANLERIIIPDSVTSIIGADEYGAFDGCSKLTIICTQGSYAEEYAIANNIPYMCDVVDLSVYAEKTDIGDLADLTTDDDTDLVSAINEVKSDVSTEAAARRGADATLQNSITDLSIILESADRAITTALNHEVSDREAADSELQEQIGDLTDLETTHDANLVAAINEVKSDVSTEAQSRSSADTALQTQIGDITDLTTDDDTNIVGAINEVNNRTKGAIIKKGTASVTTLINLYTVIPPSDGDMYNALASYSYNDKEIIKKGDNIYYTGEYDNTVTKPVFFDERTNCLYIQGYEFDVMSGYIDLSVYAEKTDIGDLTDLETTHDTNLVAAINEVQSDVSTAINAEKYYGDPDVIPSADRAFGWRVVNDKAITAAYLGSDTVVVIPYEHLETDDQSVGAFYPVTEVGADTFRNCWRITSLTIPNSVTNIGNSAFADCVNLKEIIIPNSVTNIGASAFYQCYEAENTVVIPNSVTSIGGGAFSKCTKIKGVIISNSVTSIGGSAFYKCNSLKSVTIPDSVTSIGSYAFGDCANLESITIPDSVTTIEADAFRGSNLKIICPQGSYAEQYAIANSIPYMYNALNSEFDKGLIDKINRLQYYGNAEVIPSPEDDFVKDVEHYDLYTIVNYRGDDTDVVIPYEHQGYPVKTLGPGVFQSKNIESVIIPKGVTSIGSYAFQYCTNLESVVLPDSITSIEVFTFSGCTSLASITLPKGITAISEYAFDGCTSLESVIMSNGLTSIEPYAFEGCTSLERITIPESVTAIKEYSFKDCANLKRITIPESVTRIGLATEYADLSPFDGCSSELTIICKQGSYAEFFARNHGIHYMYNIAYPVNFGNEEENNGEII